MKVFEHVIQTGAYARKIYSEIPEIFNSFKGKRALAVSRIKAVITINGEEVAFDGDETSQNRLCRAYVVCSVKNKEVEWTTYDNKPIMLNADHIVDIMDAAGSQQTSLWR